MKSIYIGNLSYTTTSSQLHDLFAQFGEVISSTLIYDNVVINYVIDIELNYVIFLLVSL